MSGEPPRHRPRSALQIAFYTQCRLWHGYLSAFAFLVLIFFSATGILLNHPDWLVGEDPAPQTQQAQLDQAQLSSARKGANSGQALAALAATRLSLLGAYKSADIDDRQASLRFEGIKGTSSVTIELATGQATARLQKADTVTMLNDLHRGKNAGAAWQGLIDISAALILILSLIGYILFFAMRFRLRTSLILTAASLAIIVGVFVAFVP